MKGGVYPSATPHLRVVSVPVCRCLPTSLSVRQVEGGGGHGECCQVYSLLSIVVGKFLCPIVSWYRQWYIYL